MIARPSRVGLRGRGQLPLRHPLLPRPEWTRAPPLCTASAPRYPRAGLGPGSVVKAVRPPPAGRCAVLDSPEQEASVRSCHSQHGPQWIEPGDRLARPRRNGTRVLRQAARFTCFISYPSRVCTVIVEVAFDKSWLKLIFQG